MQEIIIETIAGSYPVIVGENTLPILKDLLDKNIDCLIITDQNVAKYHLNTLTNLLSDYKLTVFLVKGEPEYAKNLTTYDEIVKLALEKAFKRNLNVLAFGGGAIGDLAGFFAATYKRGVTFYQIPTTLLAHDSSVGGKVALNYNEVKNAIGTFFQPKAVIYDLRFITTLPQEEKLSGFAEIIKHDLLSHGNLIKANKTLELILNEELESLLIEAIKIKYQYIKTDLYDELGTRQYLNLGHTLGHAVEVHYNISHGEAILYGLCFSLFLTNERWAKELYLKFKAWGYFKFLDARNSEVLINLMKNDKKNHNNLIKFITLEDFGKPLVQLLSAEEFIVKYQKFLKEMVM